MKKKPFAPETKQLSFLFAQQLQTTYRANDFPEIIIPMPLHPLKMLLRGFNQSLLIAQFLSTKLAYTEVKNNICIRKHFSQAQRLGSRIQRLKILPTTFDVYNQSEIQGRTLALVDDVVTTGSTASAATASLLNAGAKSVDLWCIAKTSWQN
jgi:ComF family protein